MALTMSGVGQKITYATRTHATNEDTRIEGDRFKVRCQHLMDHAAQTGDEIVLLMNDQPVLKLVRSGTKPQCLFGTVHNKTEILGDIVALLDVAWDALCPNAARAGTEHLRHSARENDV